MSTPTPGRPPLARDLRDLIRKMSAANPLWGVPKILGECFDYYHEARTHLSLDKNAPETRSVEYPETEPIRAVPHVGGLHHRYTRSAA